MYRPANERTADLCQRTDTTLPLLPKGLNAQCTAALAHEERWVVFPSFAFSLYFRWSALYTVRRLFLLFAGLFSIPVLITLLRNHVCHSVCVKTVCDRYPSLLFAFRALLSSSVFVIKTSNRCRFLLFRDHSSFTSFGILILYRRYIFIFLRSGFCCDSSML